LRQTNTVKKLWIAISLCFSFLPCLTACTAQGKTSSLLFLYVGAFVLSLVLLLACFLLVKKDRLLFRLLFSAVALVDLGYLLLALARDLPFALFANRVAYLGSAFLPLFMLLILLRVTGSRIPKALGWTLLGISALIFLMAAGQDLFGLYYRSVSFSVESGVGTLQKDYGPLHVVYPVFLVLYFSAMIAVVFRAIFKKRAASPARGVILVLAVFVNLIMYFAEQLIDLPFEMLSVSYLISESFLLCLHLVMNEMQRLRTAVSSAGEGKEQLLESPLEGVDGEKLSAFLAGIATLTATEKAIYEAYVSRATTKEVMAHLGITENTLKFHNKNLYGKLGVSSRKELLELYKQGLSSME